MNILCTVLKIVTLASFHFQALKETKKRAKATSKHLSTNENHSKAIVKHQQIKKKYSQKKKNKSRKSHVCFFSHDKKYVFKYFFFYNIFKAGKHVNMRLINHLDFAVMRLILHDTLGNKICRCLLVNHSQYALPINQIID